MRIRLDTLPAPAIPRIALGMLVALIALPSPAEVLFFDDSTEFGTNIFWNGVFLGGSPAAVVTQIARSGVATLRHL